MAEIRSCCALTDDIWKLAPSPSVSPVIPSPKTSPVNIGLPQRDYTKPVDRAIVTVDVEHIGPEDTRHHPYDREGPTDVPLFERKPWGICVNSRTEQIYAIDRHHHKVLLFGPDGEFQSHIGQGHGKQLGYFNRPIALAYDAARDRLYVTDKDNHRIQVFSGSGQFLFAFGGEGKGPGQLYYPWGIAVSKDGAIVAVVDTRNRRVQLFTSDGGYLHQYGVSPMMPRDKRNKDIFQSPRGIAFDPTGRFLYVTDFNNHNIFRLDIYRTCLEKFVPEGNLFRPSGIDVDAVGNLIVCDSKNHCLKVFRPDGQLLQTMDSVGDNLFHNPLDVAVHPAGFLAVLDLNGRIRMF